LLTFFVYHYFCIIGLDGFHVSSAQLQSGTESRQAHFRDESPSLLQSSSQPQTGLGILMNGGIPSSTLSRPSLPSSNPAYAHLTPDQHARIQEDLADRDRQASALAAAGLVADSVNLTRPATAIGHVLQAPPPLGGMPAPAYPVLSANGGESLHPPLESINWNLDLGGLGTGSGFDDMDMDFATLFDSEHEHNFLMGGGQDPISPTSGATGMGLPPPPAPDGRDDHGIPNPLNAMTG
jgi:hypothetical protein